jgi:UDP-glucose 4-epimerase
LAHSRLWKKFENSLRRRKHYFRMYSDPLRDDFKMKQSKLTYDRVMVTGGAGFIGSHTVDALLDGNVDVWVLDDLSTGSRRNLNKWKDYPKLHFVKTSVANHKMVDSVARRVDAILHLAAVVSPDVSVRTPEISNEVNVSGTLNVLRAGLKRHVTRVVYASSSSLYGDPVVVPTPEDATLEPTTPYGVSKLSAEKYCRVYYTAFGLSTMSLRYFNVFGSRQSPNPYSGVIAIFSNRLRNGVPPAIFGDGNQTRDFVHVSDVVDANLAALHLKEARGEAVNIGTGRETSINTLLSSLADLIVDHKITPVYQSARQGDVRRSCADTTKARRLLGFEPKITLRAGLEELILFLRSRHQSSSSGKG